MGLYKNALASACSVFIVFMWINTCHPASTKDFDDPAFLVNYAYATWIGTGVYTVGDRQVYTLRVPYSSHMLKESKGKGVGFRLLFPTNFIDDLDILFTDRRNEEVKALYQVGVALVPDEKYRLGFIRLKGVGVSVMVGDDIQAIRFHTGFPF